MGSVSRIAIIKFLELALAATCIGLHYKSTTNDFATEVVSVTAFCGFIVVSLGALIGYLLDCPINSRVDTFYCLAGCGLFIAAGALNIQWAQWGYTYRTPLRDYTLSKGAISVINGAIYLLDALLNWRQEFDSAQISSRN